MNHGRTFFWQLISFLPDRAFRRCVARYNEDERQRGFSCLDQYLVIAFAQLTYRDSLRNIEACLRALGGKLYPLGFHGRVARSTLADANDAHDWRIFADFAQVLIRIARPLSMHEPMGIELDQSIDALDSTTIDVTPPSLRKALIARASGDLAPRRLPGPAESGRGEEGESEAPSSMFRDWQRTQTQSSATAITESEAANRCPVLPGCRDRCREAHLRNPSS